MKEINEKEKRMKGDKHQNHHSHKMHKPNQGKDDHQHQVMKETEHHKMQDDSMDHKGHDEHKGHSVEDFKKRFIVSLILTIPILLLSHMVREFFGLGDELQFEGDLYILFILSSVVFFYGGYPFLAGIVNEIKRKQPGMMTLIAIAISVAYLYSSAVVFGVKGEVLFWELATLIDIMLLGHWIEMRSVSSASRALDELVKLLPDTAHKIDDDGGVNDVPVKSIKNGDMLLVKPGEKLPADGNVVEGNSSVNESMITGEAQPVSKSEGDTVTGGSINGEGSLKVKVERTGEESFLSQVIKLVKEAQESKSKTQNLANKAAFWLTIVSVAGGAITLLAWMLIGGADFNFALTRTVTVMVIACPHALGLAIPLVVAVSTTLSAKKGLLIKNRTAFEDARKINAVVFDKTGTLTKGEFGVTDVIAFDENYNKEDILKYAASVEAESEHPIAKGIVASSDKKFKVNKFNSIPGKGAEGEIEGKDVKVVSPGYLEENKTEVKKQDNINSLLSEGKTIVYLLINNRLTGAIALADIIREESKDAISTLREMGIRTIMLTGDNQKTAEYVGRQIGVDEIFAGVLPADKAAKIEEVKSRGMIVAMTGDGVNDAPALAKADVGIAVGAGTDVAAETADILLVKNNPSDVVSLIKFSRTTYRKMIQNLAWATGYNIIAIPLAAGVLYNLGIVLSPAMGAVLMSASTVIVAVNAKLLKI